jgi:hypothetical protein
MPYQQPPYGQGPYGPPQPGYPYPAPQKKSHKGLFIGLGVLAVVLLIGLAGAVAFVFLHFKGKVSATDLAVGDCITDIPSGALVQAVPKTDCSTPHSGEVYAVLTMPDGEYPGESTIDDWQNKCPGELQSYSSEAIADESVGVFVLYPTAETWAQGDREIVCMATTQDKRTGSIKG